MCRLRGNGDFTGGNKSRLDVGAGLSVKVSSSDRRTRHSTLNKLSLGRTLNRGVLKPDTGDVPATEASLSNNSRRGATSILM